MAKQDKWNRFRDFDRPELLRILDRMSGASEQLRLLRQKFIDGDIDLDDNYNNLFEIVEGLYGDLHMGDLVQDNQRRRKAHKDMIRRKGLKDQ